MIHLINDVWFVPLPEGATDVKLLRINLIQYRYFIGDDYHYININRPGSYSIVALRKEITEDIARGIVDWYGAGDGSVDEAGVGDTFWCYDGSDLCLDTALESLTSLFTSLSIPEDQNGVVIKKQ
jgi:hypothetical protein